MYYMYIYIYTPLGGVCILYIYMYVYIRQQYVVIVQCIDILIYIGYNHASADGNTIAAENSSGTTLALTVNNTPLATYGSGTPLG